MVKVKIGFGNSEWKVQLNLIKANVIACAEARKNDVERLAMDSLVLLEKTLSEFHGRPEDASYGVKSMKTWEEVRELGRMVGIDDEKYLEATLRNFQRMEKFCGL